MQRTTITLRGVRLVRAETVVLDEVDATFERGFTAVVGESGAGKTTLLEAITGTLAPARGALRVEPDDALVVLCAQRVDEPDARVLELARAHDRSARRWRARLSLDDDALGRWPTLSPGERKRWQVAAALAARADVLLLDEPTNHVDAETRALLVGALARFGGVALLVSHDRALIDALATRTLWLEERRAVELELPYAEAREALRLRRASAIDAHQRARRRLERVEGRLAAARERTRHADRDKKSGRRMKS
ncbi:MAG: ABC-F family ATP-binding cassette domain-containing protein, partial [Myxococcales bacterium]|nr:ABC-F family ATP-binding cassette domain-containing protein [Myxococcales bacterium]